jgi:MFS family permease
VAGAGFGLVVAPIGMFTIADVPVEHAGSASGLFSTTGQLANAVGIALVGTVFFTIVEGRVGELPADMFRPAYQVALAVVAALMLVAFLVARTLPAHVTPDPETATP